MTEEVLKIYMQMYDEVQKLEPPLSFKNPHLVVIGETTCLNDISEAIPPLNKILNKLGMETEKLDTKKYLGQIKKNGNNVITRSYIMVEIHEDYEQKRGLAQKKLIEKIEKAIGTLTPSPQLQLFEEQLPEEIKNQIKKEDSSPLSKIINRVRKHGKRKR